MYTLFLQVNYPAIFATLKLGVAPVMFVARCYCEHCAVVVCQIVVGPLHGNTDELQRLYAVSYSYYLSRYVRLHRKFTFRLKDVSM